jgi:DtxR family Mn-dependent transcriptional regulator
MGELMALSKSNVLDGIPESYQEYIVTIYRLSAQSKIVTNIDIAQKMKNAPSSVYNMLVKLKDRNLLDWEPKKKAIRLSEEGVKIGKRLILGHLIMELFLREYLGLEDQDEIHNLACKLEHHVTESIQHGFRKRIGSKAFEEIQAIVDNDSDPEFAIQKLNEVFPTPNQIINEFANQLLKRIPDSKKEIESVKSQLLNKF